ncbi:battenin CLN3 protein [Puccinia graminis f. sp. tritici]|uniref:Protein BTN n=1 Tax=Puccinia graminis f. sp. tritici TaxID=56615 RepID=A0A5B0PBC4_PUCGR|nr:battenin CLN3 protein [Puccinia graminis f. sp. tritici]
MAYKLSPIHQYSRELTSHPAHSTPRSEDSDSDSDSEQPPQAPLVIAPATTTTCTTLEGSSDIELAAILDKSSNFRFCLSLFLFGLLNNVLYVIIISAALDLVPSDVPTGVILVADITPSLLVKIGWPYFVKGQIRYARRILSCSALSFAGMMVIVIFSSVPLRLFGISLASLSSGLGEMTFLQLTTRYQGQPGVSWFASGTGAAGVFGAALWWLLRHLGVQIGLGLSSVLPICLSFTYFFLLPPPSLLPPVTIEARGGYAVVPETDQTGLSTELPALLVKSPELTFAEKLRLAKPLLIPYMLPLFAVYFAEYTINTGIAPTLLYPPPQPDSHPVFSLVFKNLRDYYPFWQLTYQIFVFFSRSSMAIFRFPALPRTLIPLPSLLQVLIFCTLLLEASSGFLSRLVSVEWIYFLVFALISLEGICGGLAYVSAYYWLGMDGHDLDQENEFRMACVGFADTFGILLASLFSSWLEPRLCGIQVSHGRTLCREVGVKN